MYLPIVIESPNFDFAIVGPTGTNEGVIVKSKQSKNELIGYANLIYSGSIQVNDRFNFGPRKYEHCWSDHISFYFDKSKINVENRQFKSLLVWYQGRSYSDIKDDISNLFNKIIFDLYKIAFDDEINDNVKKSDIEWLISPLIYLGSESTE